MATLLIMGVEQDPHVARTMGVLKQKGHDVILVDYKNPRPVTVVYDDAHNARLAVDGVPITSELLFWNRLKLRPGSEFYFDDVVEGETPAEARRRHAIRADLWLNFYRCLSRVGSGQMVNSQLAITEFWYKPFQHRLAARRGLNVPPSIVTSSKRDILGFMDAWGEVIIKSASTTMIADPEDNEGRVMLTMALSREDITEEIEGDIAEGPYFLQKRIEKSYELRIFVVGEQANAFRIDSQLRELTQVDWRLGSGILEFTPHALDPTIAAALVGLLRDAGLNYGSVDMIVDRDGKHWYLECNPDGQWEFLESAAGGGLSAQLAEHIAVLLNNMDSAADRNDKARLETA